ncbi:helicase-related protein [Nitratireductor kimnyeongensis]|nr:helicase-related protein [Nitratireductor kimnyeongensis]
MYDGSVKPVESVAANDNVMGPDSKPRRVLRTIRGVEPMYEVAPKKGDPFVVNENHILSLKATNEGKKALRYPNSHRKGGELVEISVKDYLGKPKYFKHLHKLWRTGVDFPQAGNDNYPVPPYILGAFLGDGSTTHSAAFTGMDPEVLDAVCDFAESVGVRLRVNQKPNNRAWSVYFPDDQSNCVTRNRFVARLEAAGIWGMRCEEKSVPHSYKTGSRKVRLDVLAGLLDTDGHLSKGNHFDFISKSRRLSGDVVFLARSLGLAAYMGACEKRCQTGGGGTYWRVSISGDVDVIPNRVPRQKGTARKQIKNPLVTGFSVSPVGVGEFFGFELDGDHLYLTDDFTVHHNSGKSLVLSTICKELVENYPDMRILNVTHVRELILGNYKELLNIWPFAPAGIFSAGVGRRDAHSQIIFGGVQTIASKTELIGHIDLVTVDEAHLMPRKSETQYGQLLSGLREINPDLKLMGLTATPYRLGEGQLHEGEGALFDDICYEMPIGDMIDQGYLCKPVSKGMVAGFDLSGVGKLGGDYKQKALQAAVDKIDVNRAVVDEIVKYGTTPGAERKAWLMFCSGVEHALHIRDEIRDRGFTCETITGETPAAERDRILNDFKAGKIRALTNNSVLTTGTNLPIIDLVAFLRPTLSAGLYVQMAGRGLRLFPGKEDCLFLDFAGVVRKHGPIDAVIPPHERKGDGEAPIKQCPETETDAHDNKGCGSLVHASARVCPDCGFEFPIDTAPKIKETAEDTPILSKGEPTWREIVSRRFDFHEGKGNKPPSVKVTYMAGLTAMREWLCPQHTGFAKSKADRWWIKHGGERPFPKTVMEWLERQNELLETARISVRPSGRYWDVVGHEPGDKRQFAEPVAETRDMEPANDNGPGHASWDELDDAIPF